MGQMSYAAVFPPQFSHINHSFGAPVRLPSQLSTGKPLAGFVGPGASINEILGSASTSVSASQQPIEYLQAGSDELQSPSSPKHEAEFVQKIATSVQMVKESR
jgi:hypothetical protein